MNDRDLAATIDHTLLKPEATRAQIERLCDEALEFGFAAVCTNGRWTEAVAARLAGASVRTCAVVGFPLGAMATAAKVYETRQVVAAGAEEVDMVLSLGDALGGDWSAVEQDIAAVRAACPEQQLKVILETCLLPDDGIALACAAARSAGADFVKTSTGFASGGATEHHVRLLRACVGSGLGVKASGGIRDRDTALRMLAAGANRIGCSAGVEIVAGRPVADADY
jgi:deoxyribose-phosphate aldolase